MTGRQPYAAESESCVYPSRPESVGEARAFVRKALEGCPRVGDAELVVSELATNALQHAIGDTFEVVIVRSGRLARLEVINTTTDGITPRPIKAGPQAEGQRGLFLVSLIADRHGHSPEDGRLVAWAELEW